MKTLLALSILLLAGCAADPDSYRGADAPEPPTGSRIPESADREDARRTTVMERDEIESTGAMTVEEALRRRGIR